ncbi:uncharacterized protein LOC120143906 [Hibiscus syriacus]|uniref:uncharacterized protein LOC120143906 n=1 Tax=Hibiscus syriacus TaxID=106335 RepID=UPI0019230624|nr:uncharacterized protein LOC120143906 [Hibiscus syriacus]
MAGDFNAIRNNSERSGVSFRQIEIAVFNMFIEECTISREEIHLESCTEIIKKTLQLDQTDDEELSVKLRRVKGALQKWNKECYWNVDIEAKKIEQRINELDRKAELNGLDDREREEVASCTRKLWDLLREKEDIWRQKSRLKWLKLGDENSAFFHRAVKIRSKKMILGVNLGEDNEVDPSRLRAKVFNFFSNHFRCKKEECHTELNLPFKQVSSVDVEVMESPFSINILNTFL